MTDDTDEEWNGEAQPVSLRSRSRRAPIVLAFVAGLAIAGTGATYAWMNIDKFIPLSGNDTSERPGASPGDKAMLTDLLATQQKTGEDLETLNQAVTDQQAQLKAISDQLAALVSRVDALQSSTAAPAVSPQPNARAQVAPKPVKKPRANSPGPISVGGAPLNGSPDAARH
jgi:uncharacterized coiled-coil protein SlyX